MRHSVPLGVRSPSKASQTEQGQVSTSPSQRALGAGRSSTVKGSSYVQKQKVSKREMRASLMLSLVLHPGGVEGGGAGSADHCTAV